jgi:hypothetical protein
VDDCFSHPIWLFEMIRTGNEINVPTVCFIECGLSDFDRVAAFEMLHSQLDSVSENIVKIDVNKSECANILTCQQLISHILTALLLQPQVSRVVKKYSKLTSIDQIDNTFLLSKAVESFEILFDIIEQSMIKSNPRIEGIHIVITVGFLEGVSPDAFNQFLQFLKKQHRHVSLLLCCNMANIDQYEHCEHMRFGLRSVHQTTVSSHFLFQRMFQEIIIDGALPVIFPSELLKQLYDEFDLLTCCSRTFTRRLITLIHHHFYQRKALLAMCSQVSWIQKMNLDTGAPMDSTVRKIGKVITFVDVKELGKLVIDDESQRFSMPKLQMSLERIWDFLGLARITMKFIQAYCENLPHDELQKQKFSSTNIWFALFDTNWRPRRNRLMNDFHGFVQSTVPTLCMSALRNLIGRLNEIVMSQDCSLESHPWYTDAAGAHWKEISFRISRLHRSILAMEVLLGTHCPSNTDWTLSSLKNFASKGGTEIQQQQQQQTVEEISSVSTSNQLSVMIDVSGMFAATLTKALDSSSNIKINNEVAAPIAAASTTEHSPVLVAAVTKWFPLETRSTAKSLPVPLWAIFQGLVEDTISLCTQLIDRFLRWDIEYADWGGVLVLDESAQQFYLEEMTGDLRQRFQESLSNPQDWLLQTSKSPSNSKVPEKNNSNAVRLEAGADETDAKPSKKRKISKDEDVLESPLTETLRSLPSHLSIPDVCLLLPKARSAAMIEPFRLWYEAFALAVLHDDESRKRQLAEEERVEKSQGAKGAKRKKANAPVNIDEMVSEEPSREEQLQAAYADRGLRVRFFHAMYQLEKAGWISTTYTERMGIRVTRHFFVGI